VPHSSIDRAEALSRVGVVTVTFRSEDVVGSTLAMLPVHELAGVVVVDNASDDNTVDVVASHAGVALVRSAENAGFGRGCNAGLDALPPSELVLFLNPDAVIAPDDLALLVAWLDEHPTCALVGPRLQTGDTPLPSSGELARPTQLLRLVAPGPLSRLLPPWRHPAEPARSGPVGYVEGACFLVRRNELEAVGRFDPRYFLFFEEMDLARRLQPNWTVDICPEAAAHHLVGASRRSTPNAARPAMLTSALRYVERWYGARAAQRFRVAARLLVRAQSRGGLRESGPALLEALNAA
jgi:N-acetylglucosaminyl-diphospho-decaprenol L-rhamnosyltransferase